ncbi:uncharacterized protein F5147DRAFT_777134 [Suillus discolor]|uniref:Uncharacterized protein n=1 Tax=Suillus discolor TaxID=1912936 RepID=A0A9P7JQW7_9AGAM|nr:uncharacterized protein F5147DRAFT_777134 [Suillus discolor]KAG2100220.1 hypothetical protein F5147DRAFT_777134 [Suillus discolor]
MTTSAVEETIRIALKDSDYGRILKRRLRTTRSAKPAILSPMYSPSDPTTSLVSKTARLGAGTIPCSLHYPHEETCRASFTERIRVLALHLLPLDFPDIANQAVRTVEQGLMLKKESRPDPTICRSTALSSMDATYLQEFRDEEKCFEALLDWEHNHKALADSTLRHPSTPRPNQKLPPYQPSPRLRHPRRWKLTMKNTGYSKSVTLTLVEG